MELKSVIPTLTGGNRVLQEFEQNSGHNKK